MNSSLRLRLVAIILGPLLLIALLVGGWAATDAQRRASEDFDLSLLAAALAVSRDVALSGGDALSPETNALLQDTSGGRVFYHAYAPDGVFVTGFATPPVPDTGLQTPANGQLYFDGRYLGQPVRVLRFIDAMQIDGVSGEFTFTVWQHTELRDAIARDLSVRTFFVMASLVGTVALVVWFGVRSGLRPLLSLENAIARRSPEDLAPIRRQVPVEAKGIVQTLNRLLGQVASTLTAKDEFVSNAAHQLRNPIAGVVAMSEAVASARTLPQMQARSRELAVASRAVGDLANKLLTLERARVPGGLTRLEPVDLVALLHDIVDRLLPVAEGAGVSVTLDAPDGTAVIVNGDPTMLGEAMTNLIENALAHGGPDLTRVAVALTTGADGVVLTVHDDGRGIPPDAYGKARERFGQVSPSEGTGLGLAIADAVAERHGGQLVLAGQGGLKAQLILPPNSGGKP
jgi:two-component system sensor histidine kinase TctE